MRRRVQALKRLKLTQRQRMRGRVQALKRLKLTQRMRRVQALKPSTGHEKASI